MIKQFVVLGEPKGKGRPRFTTIAGHARATTPKDTVAYENLVKMEYHVQCQGHFFPEKTPLFLLVDCFMGMPQATSKRKLKEMLSHILRPLKKPDTDNCLKIVADSLNKIAYHDDSQVVDARVRKFYSTKPRIVVTLSDQEIDAYKVKEEVTTT